MANWTAFRPDGDVPARRRISSDGMLEVWAIAIAAFVFHLIFNNRYGYFRDEFDYIMCGRHLAWGYVDQPPLTPVLSRLFIALFGESLRAVRLMPVLAVSAVIVVSGMIARELGGRRFAVALVAVAVFAAPMYMSDASLLTSNSLEPLLWMGCVYFAILAVSRDQPRYWLWFGVVAGIGLQEKYSILVLGFGVVVGLLFTPQRRFLFSKWMWIGGAAAFLIFLPNLIWNVENQWPFVQLMRNIKAEGRDVLLSPWQYFLHQFLLLDPAVAILWIIGTAALLFSPRFRPYRFLGWAFLVGFASFTTLHGKDYYLSPIYPVFIAAGAIVIDDAIDRTRQSWLKPAVFILILAISATFTPFVVPVFSVDHFLAYMNKFPIKPPRSEHSHERAPLPQTYADQFGWNEIVSEVLVAWNRIPVDERKDCAIFGQDYGQTGAIDFLGQRYGLPQSLGGHQSWWLWGPRGYSGNCMIVLDDRREVLEGLFEHVELVGTTPDNPYALERQLPVYICRGAKFGTLAQVWPKLKHWD
jgi:hypothetical protein